MAKVRIQIQLEYDFEVNTADEARTCAENVELPSEYVEDTFEIITVIDHDVQLDDGDCEGCRKLGTNNCIGSHDGCFES